MADVSKETLKKEIAGNYCFAFARRAVVRSAPPPPYAFLAFARSRGPRSRVRPVFFGPASPGLASPARDRGDSRSRRPEHAPAPDRRTGPGVLGSRRVFPAIASTEIFSTGGVPNAVVPVRGPPAGKPQMAARRSWRYFGPAVRSLIGRSPRVFTAGPFRRPFSDAAAVAAVSRFRSGDFSGGGGVVDNNNNVNTRPPLRGDRRPPDRARRSRCKQKRRPKRRRRRYRSCSTTMFCCDNIRFHDAPAAPRYCPAPADRSDSVTTYHLRRSSGGKP